MMQASHNQGSICVFACRWCSLLGAERAGRDRLELPANIRLIPVSCAGSVSADHVIQALTGGAAGVAVLGCHLGGCRHNDANRDAHARLEVLGSLLDAVGLDSRRLLVSWGTAHEAEQYAKLMRDFAALLSTLPPADIPAACSAEPVKKALSGPFSEKAEDDALRACAASIVKKGGVVLGLRRTDLDIAPGLFRSEEELDQLVAGPRVPMAGCAGLMLKDRALGSVQGIKFRSLREEALALADAPLTAACRECDADALRSLAKLHQFPEELISVLPVPCSQEQKDACRCCRGSENAPVEEPATPEARAAFWKEEFSRCVQCHWCREACPVCVCPSCSLDDAALAPLGAQSTPMGYHLARAMHVADSCVLCGACEQVCPRNLPLLGLHRAAARALRAQNYAAASNSPSPLRSERLKNAAPQWKHNLGGK